MSREQEPGIFGSNIFPPTIIHDKSLAETMAYSEKPYHDLALAAEENGLPAEATDLRVKANLTGINAGIAQVESSRAALFALQAQNNIEGDQSSMLEFLPEISPEDVIEAPQLGKNSAEVVARAAATLASLPPEKRYTTEVVRESGLAIGTVVKIVNEFKNADLITESGIGRSVTGTGPKPTLLNPSGEFGHYLQHVPMWRRAYNMRVMAARLGRDEAGTVDFLLNIGNTTVSKRPLQVRDK